MSKEISIESLYANGMGIELPISNNDNKQTQESFIDANIIDLQSIENDLSYLNVFNTLDNTHTNDMIKLHNKLNKEYGKHNKSLESYLDTRIKSMESGISDKLTKILDTIITIAKKFWNMLKEWFKKITSAFKPNKNVKKDVFNTSFENIKNNTYYVSGTAYSFLDCDISVFKSNITSGLRMLPTISGTINTLIKNNTIDNSKLQKLNDLLDTNINILIKTAHGKTNDKTSIVLKDIENVRSFTKTFYDDNLSKFLGHPHPHPDNDYKISDIFENSQQLLEIYNYLNNLFNYNSVKSIIDTTDDIINFFDIVKNKSIDENRELCTLITQKLISYGEMIKRLIFTISGLFTFVNLVYKTVENNT